MTIKRSGQRQAVAIDGWRRVGSVVVLLACVCGGRTLAQSVRVKATAVVFGDQVTLADVCDCSGLREGVVEKAESEIVMKSPAGGATCEASYEVIESALRRVGVNLATTVLRGASTCTVTRASRERDGASVQTLEAASKGLAGQADLRVGSGVTLRDVIRQTFESMVGPSGGRVEVQFGRTDEPILGLSADDHRFHVRIPGEQWLGRMLNVEVGIARAGQQSVQTVSLVASASLVREVVVAKRAINQKSTIDRADVELAEVVLESMEDGVASELGAVIGQQAKKFIAAGKSIRMADLEMVPLVYRGQLVDVTSMVGPIEVRSTAKAMSEGRLGEAVEVRVGGRRGESLYGVVVGERKVVVGSPLANPAKDRGAQLAMVIGASR